AACSLAARTDERPEARPQSQSGRVAWPPCTAARCGKTAQGSRAVMSAGNAYRGRRLGAAFLFVAWGATAFDASGAAPASPQQPVEIVVAFAPGGAGDRLGRMLQKTLQQSRLVPTVLVINKPGGAGNIAWSYLESRAGVGTTLALTTPTIM